MSRKKYYAVWGLNGAAVMTSWEKTQEALAVLERSNCKGFKTFSMAAQYAVMQCHKCRVEHGWGGITGSITYSEADQIQWVN